MDLPTLITIQNNIIWSFIYIGGAVALITAMIVLYKILVGEE